ncbi:MAG TPA: DUF512 domain-containing protein [Candidatus Syntrophosphaera thermopropionivorans]|nr:DUF512 domain-containing protein [Candidatus Syntrophosphaera thermopropionivorans]
MSLKISAVQPRSLAHKVGIRKGDTIISINSMPINDFFDLEYYSNDYQLYFELLDSEGEPKFITIERVNGKTLGIEPEPHNVRICRNHCIFCFVDQMPPKMRHSLYVKDDDYLFSYVFGNYITLNNLESMDINRIVNQHISPLYVSVHTTNPVLRQKMMRYKENYDIVKTLMELSQKGIEFHLQIVAVPGYNCGKELEKTLETLLNESIAALSIGIVPVGLTGFREHLTPLAPFNSDLALETLKIIDRYREKSPIIYGADELFLLTETPIPEADYYGDFPQLENGIGMLRLTLMNYEKKRKSFIKELDKAGGNFLLLTSTLANTVLQEIADDLNNHLKQARVKVQPIRNNFFGGYVGVSGLLTASDILSQVQPLPQESIIIPENLFNTDGLTLDDVSQLELHDKLQVPILIVDPYFEDWEWI